MVKSLINVPHVTGVIGVQTNGHDTPFEMEQPWSFQLLIMTIVTKVTMWPTNDQGCSISTGGLVPLCVQTPHGGVIPAPPS